MAETTTTTTTSNDTQSTTKQQDPTFPPAWLKPNLPALLTIHRDPTASPDTFTSYATSQVSLPPGALFARINDAAITTNTPTYSSVQAGRNTHIELRCDLVFVNHSCAPNLEFDMGRLEVRVARDANGGKGLREGEMLTFFYPSSEWEMAQPFQCECGADGCLGRITGAGEMEERVLRRYWLNGHIEELLAEREVKNEK